MVIPGLKIKQRISRWFAKATDSTGSLASMSKMPEGYLRGEVARNLVLAGTAPESLWTDTLIFESNETALKLPRKLRVRSLHIKNCPQFRALPEDLFAQEVFVSGCPKFQVVPSSAWATLFHFNNCSSLTNIEGHAGHLTVEQCPGFCFPTPYSCHTLRMPSSFQEELPEHVKVGEILNLRNSRALKRISRQELTELELSGCEQLEYLPDALRATTLNLAACVRLKWQEWADVEVERLDLRDCHQVRKIPEWLTVKGEIDVANTGLVEIPEHLRSCQISWRGVKVNERIAFRPETITPQEILRERNSELRRVMLERVGWERFFAEVQPKRVHWDRDSGGDRLLLEFEFDGEFEAVVILSVHCPSTGRKYFIRVPPKCRTCHDAAAWIAGFDNPVEYQTIVET